MRSRLIVAFCTLVGTVTLVACSGKVSTVPGEDPENPSPGSSSSSPGNKVDPSAPTSSPTSSPGSPGAASCFAADLGTMCRDAPDKAKWQASAICEGAGATLAGLYGDSSGRCTATCCFASDLPIPPDPGAPPKPDPGIPPVPTTEPTTPPAPACTYAGFGDGVACVPYADIGSIAQAACSATGRSVSSVHLGGTCSGGVLFGKVECCGAPNTPR